MREILFRGKRVDKGEWTEGYLFKQWNRTFLLWGMTGDIPNMTEVISETVGQYTGLTDKNGEKIFEGDIIRGYWNAVFVVYYDEEYCQFRGKVHEGLHRALDYCGFMNKIEVIGNIYDNPELLGVEK